MRRKITHTTRLLLLGGILLTSISACKKGHDTEISNMERIEQAKQWYDLQQKGLSTVAQSTKGQSVVLSFNPKWENAQVTHVNGQYAVVAPVSTNLENIMGKQTEYHLVISNENGNYTSKIVSVNNLALENRQLDSEELYQAAFGRAKLSPDKPLYADIRVYDRGFKLTGQTLFKGKSHEVIDLTASVSPREAANMQKQQLTEIKVCTEWILVTFEYDDYGNIYNVWEQSLGKSCETYYQEQTLDHIEDEDQSAAESAMMAATNLEPANDATGSISNISESEQERQKGYSWTVLVNAALGWSIRSHEIGTHEKPEHNWKWKSLVHSGYTTPGKPTWINCDITHAAAIPNIGTFSASIEVRFNVQSYVGVKGINIGPPAKDVQITSPTWDMPYN